MSNDKSHMNSHQQSMIQIEEFVQEYLVRNNGFEDRVGAIVHLTSPFHANPTKADLVDAVSFIMKDIFKYGKDRDEEDVEFYKKGREAVNLLKGILSDYALLDPKSYREFCYTTANENYDTRYTVEVERFNLNFYGKPTVWRKIEIICDDESSIDFVRRHVFTRYCSGIDTCRSDDPRIEMEDYNKEIELKEKVFQEEMKWVETLDLEELKKQAVVYNTRLYKGWLVLKRIKDRINEIEFG